MTLIALLALGKADAQAIVSLGAQYQNYYRISDVDRNRSWDENMSNRNLYGYNGYHGGTNQHWLVMPVHPGSAEYIIAGRATGNIVDINLNNYNIYLYQGGYHGGDNQTFSFLPVSGSDPALIPTIGRFHIKSLIDSRYVFDVSNGSRDGNNIYFGGFHGGTNQQFTLSQAWTIPSAFQSYRKANNDPILQPKAPTDMLGTGLCGECNETFKGEAIIPFPLIKNEAPPSYQAQNTPYYRMESSQLWKIIKVVTLPAGPSRTETFSQTTAVKDVLSTEVATKTSLSFSASGKISAKLFDLVSAKISKSVGFSFEKTIKTVSSHEENRSETKTVSLIHDGKKNVLYVEYQLVDRYKLYRTDGTKILEWDVNYGPEFNTRVSYIEDPMGGRVVAEQVQVLNKGYNTQGIYELEIKTTKELNKPVPFSVDAVYPNPMQSEVNVNISTQETSHVQVVIYNINGQKVADLHKTLKPSAMHTIKLDGLHLKEGMYLMKIDMVSVDNPTKKFSYQHKLIQQK